MRSRPRNIRYLNASCNTQDLLSLSRCCRRLRRLVPCCDAAWQRQILADFGLLVQVRGRRKLHLRKSFPPRTSFVPSRPSAPQPSPLSLTRAHTHFMLHRAGPSSSNTSPCTARHVADCPRRQSSCPPPPPRHPSLVRTQQQRLPAARRLVVRRTGREGRSPAQVPLQHLQPS